MGEAFRRARAARYAQQMDQAQAKWLEPNLLRLFKGTLAAKDLTCSASVPADRLPPGSTALLLLGDDGTCRVISGIDQVGEVSPTSLPLLRAWLDEAGDCKDALTSLPVRIVRYSAFAPEFVVRLQTEGGTGDAA